MSLLDIDRAALAAAKSLAARQPQANLGSAGGVLGGIVGSVIPGVGTAIGSAIGGGLGSAIGSGSQAAGAGIGSQAAASGYSQQAEQAMQNAYNQEQASTNQALEQLNAQIADLTNPATAKVSPYVLSGSQLEAVNAPQMTSVLGTPGVAGNGAVPMPATPVSSVPVAQNSSSIAASATPNVSFAPTQRAAAAPASTSSPQAEQAAIQSAVQRAISAEGASGSYGTYANNIKANLASSGAFTPAQLQSLDNSPWIQSLLSNSGTMQDKGGGNAAAFLNQGTSALLGNLPATVSPTASPVAGTATAAQAPATVASTAAMRAAPATTAKPLTEPVSPLVGNPHAYAGAGYRGVA